MADIDSLAAALFGSKRAETQEVLTDATTRTYIGIALTDSVDGTVMVDLGGDVTLPDDIEGVSEHSAEGVEVATGPGVRAGDEVVVTLVGGTPLKTPMVTGVAGEGDGQDARIATASAAAEAAWDWADDAHDAATDAQESADAAQASAESAASAASAAVISAASAEASAQQAIGDAAAASSAAASAQASAQQAIEDASDAHDAAVAAQAEATLATQSANEAKGAATRANTAANDALTQLATVEDVIGVVDWVTEHGTYSLTTDTAIDPDKVYYTRTGSGTQADPYVYTAVAEPDVSDIGSYYELDIDEALSQYVASHLALTNAGLYVLKDSSGYKLLLANDGMQVIDPAGHTVATYGESITFDSERPQRIGGTDSYIEWRDTDSDGVPDSLAIVADSIELSGGQSVSTGSGNVWANHSSATSASGISSWSDTFVAPTTAKPYVWMKSYSIIDGQRVYGNPACITGATGQQGPQGPQGETGDTGVGIQSYVQMWAKSTSSSVAPTSGWSASRPTSIGTNEHLWVRIDTTWTDNTTTQGTPVVDQNTTDLWHTSAALRVDVGSISSDVSALQTTVSGHTATIGQHTTAIQQNTTDISLRATKTEVQQVRPAYASSSTAAGTAAKVATIDPAVTGYALYKGASVAVTFSTANTAATPTLNLNSTGAKQIRSYTGAALSEAEYKWAAGATIDLVYDGTYWRMQDSGSVKRVTAAEASISVNAENIESKVSKNGVISSINQSAETVKIQASKVEIDGTAIFTAISSDVDDAITDKGYQTSSQVESAITSKGYATTTQAQGYATTAKSEAISAAATDATTKANAAETNAKAYTDALEIGGRNFLRDTQYMTSWGKNNGTTIVDGVVTFPTVTANTWREIWPSQNFKYDLIRNKQVTFSCEANVPSGQTSLLNLCIGLDTTETAYSRKKYRNQSVTITGTGTWQKVSVTADITDAWFNAGSGTVDYDNCWVTVRPGAWSSSWASFQVRLFKLELGNKATDWTPEPEDTSQYRVVTTSYSYTLAQWLTYAAEGYTDSWITGTSGQGVRAGDTVMLKGTNSDNGSAVYVLMTVNTLNSSGAIASATSHGLIDPTAGQRADSAQSTANAAAPKANAVKRTQRIWYRTNASGAPSTPGTASSNWVTKADDGNDAWTKMHIAISSTHKYIYTCEQYEMANGTVGYTSVLLDNTITVIDGGNIITGTVTANKLNAADINASKTLTVGAMTDAAASTILNSNVQIGGRNYAKTLVATGTSYTANGVTITVIGSSTVRLNGTSTATTVTSDWFGGTVLSEGTYALWLTDTSDGKIYFRLGKGTSKTHVYSNSGNYNHESPYVFTATESDTYWIRVVCLAGTYNNVETSYIIERGNKATDWTPAPEDQTAYVNETAYQFSQPNLSPFFSMSESDVYNASTNPSGYWKTFSSNYITILDDGWAHVSASNSGSSYIFCNYFTTKDAVPESFKTSTKYTFLVETRNVTRSGSIAILATSHFANELHAFTASPAFNVTGAESRYLSVTSTSDISSIACFTRGYVQVAAGASIEMDLRISLYEGEYSGPYKPYSGDMLFATNTALAGTNESLEGAITDIGELSDQLVGTVTEQNKTITDIQTYLNSLRKDLDAEIQSRQQWLNFNSAEGLVVGAAGSTFKTVTTNTSQQFRSGGTVLAETSGTEFVAPVMRSDQLLIGNWMWTRRDNGNLSLKWIG